VRQDWPSMLTNITLQLGCTGDPLIKFDDWCEQAASETATAELGLLMDFFVEDFEHMACGGVILDTTNSRRVSRTLRRATPVSDELVGSYIRAWKQAGILR